jgi:FkbM family methyltransferase
MSPSSLWTLLTRLAGAAGGRDSMRLDADRAMDDMTALWARQVPHESDFLFFRRLAGGTPSLLDVGANAGQSALSFAMVCPRASIVSFEPNPLYEPVLRHVRDALLPSATSFDYHLVGCGAAAGELELIVPYVDGQPYFQEASVSVTQFEVSWVRDRLASYGRHLTFERCSVRIRVLDDFELRPTVCKIDTEGNELGVLEGMAGTIESCWPMFLIENNDYQRVTPYLERRGYTPQVYDATRDALVPMTPAPTNTFYLRSEHRRL